MIWGKGKKQKPMDTPQRTTEADPMARIEEVNADLQEYKKQNDKRVSDLSTQVQSNATDLGARVHLLREVLERQGYIDPNMPEAQAKEMHEKAKREVEAQARKQSQGIARQAGD